MEAGKSPDPHSARQRHRRGDDVVSRPRIQEEPMCQSESKGKKRKDSFLP